MKKSTRLYTLTLAATFILCSAAVTGWTADWHGHGRAAGGWHGHAREARGWRNHHWHGGHPVYENGGPYYTYAPPLVVDTPPAYYAPEPGLSITVPLDIH